MNNVQYLQARAKLESEYQRKRQVLDEAWTMFNSEPHPEPINSHSEAVEQIRGSWRLLADQAVNSFPEGQQFTIREVMNGIEISDPSAKIDLAALSTHLKKLADTKQIKLVEPGRGRRATIYSRPKK